MHQRSNLLLIATAGLYYHSAMPNKLGTMMKCPKHGKLLVCPSCRAAKAGSKTSAKKTAAVRENLKKAMAARWPLQVQRSR
jgi:hypothetical protein